MKILVITDIGRDIDDTLALLTLFPYLKENPKEHELVAVVACGSDADLRAGVARGWMRLLGVSEQIPIAVSRPKGVKGAHIPPGFPKPEHANLYPGTSNTSFQDSKHTTQLILDLAKKHKGELTITVWGPLTVLADALDMDSEGVLKQVGAFHMQGQADVVERRLIPSPINFNINEDKEAAQKVFEALQDHVPISLLGKHSAYSVKLTRDDFQEWEDILAPIKPVDTSASIANACTSTSPPTPSMLALAKLTMNVFRTGNPSKFAEIYGEESKLDDWFERIKEISMPYDALAMLMMFEGQEYQFQHACGKHRMCGSSPAGHDLTNPDNLKQIIKKRICTSMRLIVENAKKKILVLTDIGRNIDDTLALLTLLPYVKNNAAELVGVVACGSESHLRGSVARGWLRLLGVPDTLPIAAGRGKGVKGAYIPPDFPSPEDSNLYMSTSKSSFENPAHTSELILELAKKYKDKLIIVALGPLTALADALDADHEGVLKRIRAFHMQGQADIVEGRLVPSPIAFNVSEDKEAALKVFDVLQDHVPIHLLGKHSAYAIKLTREDFQDWDDIINSKVIRKIYSPNFPPPDRLNLMAVAKHTLEVFRSGNLEKFVEIYGDSARGDDWFETIKELSCPYDTLALLTALEHGQYQPSVFGKHSMCGCDASSHDLTDPEILKGIINQRVKESMRRIAESVPH